MYSEATEVCCTYNSSNWEGDCSQHVCELAAIIRQQRSHEQRHLWTKTSADQSTAKVSYSKLCLHNWQGVMCAAKSSRYSTERCSTASYNRQLLTVTAVHTEHVTGRTALYLCQLDHKTTTRIWPDITATADCCHTNMLHFRMARVEIWVGYHVTARSDVICHILWHNWNVVNP